MADRIKNYQQEADQITTLKAIRTDLGVTPSSYTPDATVVTKDRVVTFAQAEEELVVLSDIEKGVKQQIVDVDIAQKDISNIKALLQGHLYDYQTDSTSAYAKSVPAGAMPYAGLEKIGGKTVVWNQYADPTNTATRESNTDQNWMIATGVSYIAGHKYIVGWKQMNALTDYERNCCVFYDGSTHYEETFAQKVHLQEGRYWWEFTATQSTNNGNVRLWVFNVSNTVSFQDAILCDLTLMFGSGNEPTAEQFEALFPANNYPISTPTLLSAGVTEVVSKDTNNDTLQTYYVPAEVQALEGYGWSAGDVYNYVDFERKKFVKKVNRVVLNGTQTINDINWMAAENGCGWIYPYALTNNIVKGYSDLPNIVSDKLLAKTYPELQQYNVGISTYNHNDRGIVIWQNDTSLNTATAINNYLSANPITVYYELATPIETDISQYLTNDNLINVESGGTLTFPNQNGTDYQIPVPSEETYMIDLQASL